MNAQEKIDQLMKAEMEHIRSVGGILNLPEADSVLNDLNREKLKALKELHGHLYLGRINIHDTAHRGFALLKEPKTCTRKCWTSPYTTSAVILPCPSRIKPCQI